jgi:hypothetical protein
VLVHLDRRVLVLDRGEVGVGADRGRRRDDADPAVPRGERGGRGPRPDDPEDRQVVAAPQLAERPTAVDVLQATTIALTSDRRAGRALSVEKASTSSSDRVPYGARALSPR